MSTSRFTRRHLGYLILGGLLIAIGIFLPRAWYDALPSNPEIPAPPLKGVTLLQWTFVLEGLALIGLGYCRWVYVRLDPAERAHVRTPLDPGAAVSARVSLLLLAGITLLALVLRSHELNSDFWLDEIRATLDAREMSVLEVTGSYVRSNVHLLNTLLMKLSFAVFGEAEWSARLPVVLFGTASVPVLYWVGRSVASREVSLGAALLLAVSYHHIFFSQNARGYVPYIFFSLVSSALLVRGFRDDRRRTWVLYVLTMVLNFASILISGFVFASHILVGAFALVQVKLRGDSPLPLFRRLALVFGSAATLGFHLYSVQLPQVIAYLDATYASPTSGYRLFSAEFVRELTRGLSSSLGPTFLFGALPFLVIAGIGFYTFVRRQWTLAAALVLPAILTAVLLFIRGLTTSPRFFLLGLPVAVLTAVLTADLCARFVARKLERGTSFRLGAVTAIVLLLTAGSLASLGRYYSVAKQPYRASLEYAAAERRPGEIVVAIHTARRGCAYYAPGAGLSEDRDLFLADSLEALEVVLSAHGQEGALLVTSMPRALRLVHPEMEARIEGGWQVARTFPATIGDGQISVWKQRDR
jgi:mannosyltransferase